MAVKPLAIKVTAGIIGTGSAIAIAQQGYQALQNKSEEETKESNRNKLISQKYEILGKEETHNDTWNAILNSYKEIIKTKNDLAFEGFAGTESGTALATLKNKCEDSLNSKNEALLNKAKKWCTIPTTVSQGLKGRKIFKLDNAKDDTEDKAEWDEKIKSYTKAGNNNKIKNLNFDSAPINTPTLQHRNLIREKCKELSLKKSYEGDYEEALKNSEDWCSIAQRS